MRDYFKGWEEKENVQIPEIKKAGFQENIVVRKPVQPVREKMPGIEAAKSGQDGYDGDAPTVVLTPEMKIQAYIRRISTGEETVVDKDGFIIGKSIEADFTVTNNPTVSRKHVKIHIQPDGYWLEDLNSSNHVFIDGAQITKPVRLTDGMKFTLALDEPFEFSIRVEK